MAPAAAMMPQRQVAALEAVVGELLALERGLTEVAQKHACGGKSVSQLNSELSMLGELVVDQASAYEEQKHRMEQLEQENAKLDALRSELVSEVSELRASLSGRLLSPLPPSPAPAPNAELLRLAAGSGSGGEGGLSPAPSHTDIECQQLGKVLLKMRQERDEGMRLAEERAREVELLRSALGREEQGQSLLDAGEAAAEVSRLRKENERLRESERRAHALAEGRAEAAQTADAELLRLHRELEMMQIKARRPSTPSSVAVDAPSSDLAAELSASQRELSAVRRELAVVQTSHASAMQQERHARELERAQLQQSLREASAAAVVAASAAGSDGGAPQVGGAEAPAVAASTKSLERLQAHFQRNVQHLAEAQAENEVLRSSLGTEATNAEAARAESVCLRAELDAVDGKMDALDSMATELRSVLVELCGAERRGATMRAELDVVDGKMDALESLGTELRSVMEEMRAATLMSRRLANGIVDSGASRTSDGTGAVQNPSVDFSDEESDGSSAATSEGSPAATPVGERTVDRGGVPTPDFPALSPDGRNGGSVAPDGEQHARAKHRSRLASVVLEQVSLELAMRSPRSDAHDEDELDAVGSDVEEHADSLETMISSLVDTEATAEHDGRERSRSGLDDDSDSDSDCDLLTTDEMEVDEPDDVFGPPPPPPPLPPPPPPSEWHDFVRDYGALSKEDKIMVHRRRTVARQRFGVLKEGYLFKSPPPSATRFFKKRWRRRWFMLTPRAMVYFKSPTDSIPKGMVDLLGAQLSTARVPAEQAMHEFHVRPVQMTP